MPLQKNDEAIVTQYPMTTLEELGLLKMDFLGLRNLTVIHDAEEMIRQTVPDFDMEAVPMDDAATFKMLGEGHAFGVFQFESAGMRNVINKLGPESIEDLIAVISLYRPGPMAVSYTHIGVDVLHHEEIQFHGVGDYIHRLGDAGFPDVDAALFRRAGEGLGTVGQMSGILAGHLPGQLGKVLGRHIVCLLYTSFCIFCKM